MAAMVAPIRMKSSDSERMTAWQANLLSELPGLMLGFVTLTWILSSIYSL